MSSAQLSSIPVVGGGSSGGISAAEIRISPIESEAEIAEGFELVAEAFGRQARDAIWTGLNPGWDERAPGSARADGEGVVEVDGGGGAPRGGGGGGGGGAGGGGSGGESAGGRARCLARLVDRWRARTFDRHGNPNTVFLKATVPATVPGSSNGSGSSGGRSNGSGSGSGSRETIAGLAIWVQASFVPGYGDPPAGDLGATDLEALHPGNEREQRFLAQCYRSLVARRVDVVRAKQRAFLAATGAARGGAAGVVVDDAVAAAAAAAAAAVAGVVVAPSVMVLDLCAVHPAYQRRGIASRLVRWGLEEARRRGSGSALEAITEASVMGRSVYERLGFRPVAEIEYEVDEEFQARDRPSNLFMRTGDGAGVGAGTGAGTGAGVGVGAGAGPG
ncbi:hypothetical protein SLS62_000943 [Diatrype stigma]|uniref:N-acetyltransferase domain-containing protein n=1 Tax=Diatrype stigma TaxID=117547 RepID=A0AAN9V0T7_9PEZI